MNVKVCNRPFFVFGEREEIYAEKGKVRKCEEESQSSRNARLYRRAEDVRSIRGHSGRECQAQNESGVTFSKTLETA